MRKTSKAGAPTRFCKVEFSSPFRGYENQQCSLGGMADRLPPAREPNPAVRPVHQGRKPNGGNALSVPFTTAWPARERYPRRRRCHGRTTPESRLVGAQTWI